MNKGIGSEGNWESKVFENGNYTTNSRLPNAEYYIVANGYSNMHQNHGYLLAGDDAVACTLGTWGWLILVVVKDIARISW